MPEPRKQPSAIADDFPPSQKHKKQHPPQCDGEAHDETDLHDRLRKHQVDEFLRVA